MRAFDRVSHSVVGQRIVSVDEDGRTLRLEDGRRIVVSDPWAVEIRGEKA